LVSVRAFGGNLKIMYGIYKLIANHIEMLSIDDSSVPYHHNALPDLRGPSSHSSLKRQISVHENQRYRGSLLWTVMFSKGDFHDNMGGLQGC